MKFIKKYLKSCRPIPSSMQLLPISMVFAFSHSYCSNNIGSGSGGCEEQFNYQLALLCSFIALLIIQYSYIINSIIDYVTGVDNEETVDRTLFDTGNTIGDLTKYCLIIISIITISCYYPIHWWSKSIESYWLLVKLIWTCFTFASLYTFSKYIGLGGFVYSFYFTAPIQFVYLALTNNYVSWLNYSHPLVITSIIYTVYSHCAILTNCIRDYDEDKAAGIYTYSRVLGLNLSFILLYTYYIMYVSSLSSSSLSSLIKIKKYTNILPFIIVCCFVIVVVLNSDYLIYFYFIINYGNKFFWVIVLLFTMNITYFTKKLNLDISMANGNNRFVPLILYSFAIYLNKW